ncbi:serine/threonine-protein kinase [bacterium]|nr:serine/threonine-protein kinase [bacterium]
MFERTNMIGKTISHYKIIEKLGEGGMGVVYKAEDTKLKRTVALKFLPPHALGSEEEKARFIHEAQAAAALSHPNICTVYEIDDAHEQTFIAMEYVKGESLKEKLSKGPLKLKEVIQIGIQAAEGLNEAHRKKMIHRDIKSANIMVTENNRVKIMDFGLAKLSGRTKVTRTGATVGTISYMSPEQVKGEKVDHRSDIWSLGVVLYEMISGQFPFPGEYEQAVVYNIMNEELEPLTALRTGVPMKLEEIVNKLLVKDPDNRYQHIDELPVDLKAIDFSSTSQVSRRSISEITTKKMLVKEKQINLKIAIPLLIITAIIFPIVTWLFKPKTEKQVVRFPYFLPQGETMSPVRFALSPDGTRIVFGTAPAGEKPLYIRRVDQHNPIPIENTEGAYTPFFSPDGRQLCFYANNQLKKVRIDGGPAQTLCDVPSLPYWGTWGDDDTIIFACADWGLLRVSASDGIQEVILKPDSGKISTYYCWPEMLPGSKAVLYTTWEGTSYDEANIAVLSLESGQSETLIRGGTSPRYSPTGHILFGRSGSCWAVPFNARKLEITGDEVLVQESVYIGVDGFADFRVSKNGTLVYIPGGEELLGEQRILVLVDRQGHETPLTDIQRSYGSPRFSPDGNRVAVDLFENYNYHIWIHDVVRNTQIPLTSGDNRNEEPIWTPDGKRITFQSNRSGVRNIYWKRVDDIGEAEPLCASEKFQDCGTCWSEDGTLFAFIQQDSITGYDIWVYTTRDSMAELFLNTPNREYTPAISPNGKWIAYTSNKTGRNEIYIKAYPGPGGEEPVSTNGGFEPTWAKDGRELFYREENKMMVVSVETEPSLRLGLPELLFEEPYYSTQANSQYDIHPDGNRFLMLKTEESESSTNQINIVLNWFEVLKEKMAGAGE